jgi:hypothetical protein
MMAGTEITLAAGAPMAIQEASREAAMAEVSPAVVVLAKVEDGEGGRAEWKVGLPGRWLGPVSQRRRRNRRSRPIPPSRAAEGSGMTVRKPVLASKVADWPGLRPVTVSELKAPA